MILAYARAVAASPLAGIDSSVSAFEWSRTSACIRATDGTKFRTLPISPVGPPHLVPSRNPELVEGAVRDIGQLPGSVDRPGECPQCIRRVEHVSEIVHKGVGGVFSIDQQRNVAEHRLPVLKKPTRPGAGEVVVSRRTDDLNGSTALSLRNAREILCELDGGGDARGIVAGTLEERIPVGDDEDLLGTSGSARRHLVIYVCRPEPLHLVYVEAHNLSRGGL